MKIPSDVKSNINKLYKLMITIEEFIDEHLSIKKSPKLYIDTYPFYKRIAIDFNRNGEVYFSNKYDPSSERMIYESILGYFNLHETDVINQIVQSITTKVDDVNIDLLTEYLTIYYSFKLKYDFSVNKLSRLNSVIKSLTFFDAEKDNLLSVEDLILLHRYNSFYEKFK